MERSSSAEVFWVSWSCARGFPTKWMWSEECCVLCECRVTKRSDREHSKEVRRLIILYKGEGLLWRGCSFMKLGG